MAPYKMSTHIVIRLLFTLQANILHRLNIVHNTADDRLPQNCDQYRPTTVWFILRLFHNATTLVVLCNLRCFFYTN